MSERLSITPLGPYIGAQISGADLTLPRWGRILARR